MNRMVGAMPPGSGGGSIGAVACSYIQAVVIIGFGNS
jgi:hypothetical protein